MFSSSPPCYGLALGEVGSGHMDGSSGGAAAGSGRLQEVAQLGKPQLQHDVDLSGGEGWSGRVTRSLEPVLVKQRLWLIIALRRLR